MAFDVRQGTGTPTGRWWLPHFDKLEVDDRRRLARLVDRIILRSKTLNGVEPANTHQLVEALLLVLAEDRDVLDRRHHEIMVKLEELETENVLLDPAARMNERQR